MHHSALYLVAQFMFSKMILMGIIATIGSLVALAKR